MSDHPKVCFIAGTLGMGGAERQLYYMLKALTQNNIQCQVLSLTRNETYDARIQQLGLRVVWVGRYKNPILRILRILWEVAKYQPSVIQSAHSFASLYAVLAGYILRKPSIAAVRSNGVAEFARIGFGGRLVLKLASNVVANSRTAADAVKHKYPQKQVFVLDNAIDCEYFCPIELSQSDPIDKIYLLNVGRATSEKRQDLFLQVVFEVRRMCNNVSARIVGSGPLLPVLRTMTDNMHIHGYVEFLGQQVDMPAIYQQSALLVSTSDFEGMPNVIMEAMACGLPVVATHAGGTTDLIDHGVNGFVTNCGDVEALVQYVFQLVTDDKLRDLMGLAARQSVVDRYSIDVLYPKLMQLYETIITRQVS